MLIKKDETLGIYIHIPFCIRKCNYCDFPSLPNMDDYFWDYTDAVCKEIEAVSGNYSNYVIDSVFFGGGTPSVLPAMYIAKIYNTLSKAFDISKNAEISIEVNPGTISTEKATVYKELNFNRISIGLQSANNSLLKLMGRIHTKEIFEECIEIIKKCGFKNINADIIFGIPNQTMEDWQETIELVVKQGLTHLSCYSLKIEENTPWHELNEKGELAIINEDLEREMYYWAISKLDASGFTHYEISNFAKPGYQSLHNLKYWTDKPYLGFGAAAHSNINNVRHSNVENTIEYIKKINKGQSPIVMREHIGPDEKLSERLILGLRLIGGVNINCLEQEFGSEALKKYKEKINELEKKELVYIKDGMLKLTGLGLDFANLVWSEFV